MTSTMTKAAPKPSGESREGLLAVLSGRLRLIPVLVSLVFVWLVFWALNPLFLSPRNLSNLVLQTVVTATLALGLVLILLVAEIDLSVAALSGAAAAIAGRLAVTQGWNPWMACGIALVFGLIWGLLQAVLVMYGGPSFIVTLAGSLVLQGLLLYLLPSAGQISLANSDLKFIVGAYLTPIAGWVLGILGIIGYAVNCLSKFRARRSHGLPADLIRNLILPIAATAIGVFAVILVLNSYRGIPIVVAFLIGILAFFSYISTQTRFGVRLYAVGGNREAARRAGIPVRRTLMWSFALSGFFAALAGLFASSRLLGISNQSGGGSLLLEAIAAAVIGGTSLFGGRGNVWSALLGALVIGSIGNGMDLLGLPTEVKLAAQGGILIIATLTDVIISRGSIKWPRA
jgi:D-xylose transport system permease protein